MPIEPARRTISKAESYLLLTRAGYSVEFIRGIHEQLADPIDLDRDAPTLLRYGIASDRLVDRLGGSP
jgi:hypothetical protein